MRLAVRVVMRLEASRRSSLFVVVAACIALSSLSGCATDAGDEDEPMRRTESPVAAGRPYPARTALGLKAIQPDFQPATSAPGVGGVSMNLVWSDWEPAPQAPPCASGSIAYDGHCFRIPQHVDRAIRDWSGRGVVVTAVLYGVPAWARTRRACSPPSPGFAIFCAPDDARDYARFVGMIADRYDGTDGRGRVADFVIHNEVNTNTWFDVGCGSGRRCDETTWIDTYAANFNAAYDAVKRHQSEAKVFVSLDHQFGAGTSLGSDFPVLSGESLLRGVFARAGSRAVRVAFHPYTKELVGPTFTADDWPKITPGNIGTLAGWLRKNAPDRPASWEIHLTESGINSHPSHATEQQQADWLCQSYVNVLGTPGIESYVYHRLVDHPDELAGGLAIGLLRPDSGKKAAWSVFANANASEPSRRTCGFQDLPYTRLARSHHPRRGHWASTRLAPPGFRHEGIEVRLLRDAEPETTMLYECQAGEHNLVTPDPRCEGLHPMGPVGHVFTRPGPGRVALHRCTVAAGKDHFISLDPSCEGHTHERLLGYAVR